MSRSHKTSTHICTISTSIRSQQINIDISCLVSKKSLPSRLRPFLTIDHIRIIAFKLELPDSMGALHSILTYLYYVDNQLGPSLIRPPLRVVLDGELEYDMEWILDKRMSQCHYRHKDLPQYLVKWKFNGHNIICGSLCLKLAIVREYYRPSSSMAVNKTRLYGQQTMQRQPEPSTRDDLSLLKLTNCVCSIV